VVVVTGTVVVVVAGGAWVVVVTGVVVAVVKNGGTTNVVVVTDTWWRRLRNAPVRRVFVDVVVVVETLVGPLVVMTCPNDPVLANCALRAAAALTTATANGANFADGTTAATGNAVVVSSVPPTRSASELATTERRGRRTLNLFTDRAAPDAGDLVAARKPIETRFRLITCRTEARWWLERPCCFFMLLIFKNQNHGAIYGFSTIAQFRYTTNSSGVMAHQSRTSRPRAWRHAALVCATRRSVLGLGSSSWSATASTHSD